MKDGVSQPGQIKENISLLSLFLRRLHSLSVFLTWCFVKPQREKHLSRVCAALCHGRNAPLVRDHSVRVQVHVRVCFGCLDEGEVRGAASIAHLSSYRRVFERSAAAWWHIQ